MGLVEFPGEDGARVYIQSLPEEIPAEGGLARAGAGDRVVRAARETWRQALAGMRAAAEGALHELNDIDPVPDEVELSFGVAINGGFGATIVSTKADAHLQVRVVWKKPAGDAASGG